MQILILFVPKVFECVVVGADDGAAYPGQVTSRYASFAAVQLA